MLFIYFIIKKKVGELFPFLAIFIYTCQDNPFQKVPIYARLYMYWPVKNDLPIWPSNLVRTMYSHGPPVLSEVTTKKALNPDSVPKESDVLCEWYGLSRGLRWNTHLQHTSMSTHLNFSKLMQRMKGIIALYPGVISFSSHFRFIKRKRGSLFYQFILGPWIKFAFGVCTIRYKSNISWLEYQFWRK